MSKKKNKNSINSLANELFYKDEFKGFQFTAGNTPFGVEENRPLEMSCSLNFRDKSVVIDFSETDLKDLIEKEVFGNNHYIVSLEKLRDLQEQFRKLDYEVEEAEMMGIWYWFRVHCKPEEIEYHVNRLKDNLIL